MLEFEPDLRPGSLQGKALRPLQNRHSGLGEHIFHAQRFEVMEALNAVQVGVEDFCVRGLAIDMNKRERRARDVVFAGRAQASNNSFGQRGFATPEVSGEQN